MSLILVMFSFLVIFNICIIFLYCVEVFVFSIMGRVGLVDLYWVSDVCSCFMFIGYVFR